VANQEHSKKKTDTNRTLTTVARRQELEFEADVLFQRLGNKWYAFSVVEDDCLMTEVSEEEVQKTQKRMMKRGARAA